MDNKTVVHIISHFHWDREWYQSFREFQIRLVKAIDSLLDLMSQQNGFDYFLFDGQTVALLDYLEIRPEKKDQLLKLINEGRIEVGPWYVQADEFLVSGEALIRNLQIGRRVLQKLGLTQMMKIGYVPDQFGHNSQLPQLMKKAGIHAVVFSRGIMPDTADKSEFVWKSPDGSEVLAILQPEFYGNAEVLPDHAADLKKFVEKAVARLKAGTTVPESILFMNGRDHYAPQANLSDVLHLAKDLFEGIELKHSTLSAFVQEIARSSKALKVVEGELRQGMVLSNTASSRVYLKKANLTSEILLENWVEPFSILNWKTTGSVYPGAFIYKAWEILLKNHAHDSICGCSIDKVHDKMMTRFGEVEDIANSLLNSICKNIVSHIDKHYVEYDYIITVFNPLQWSRRENVSVNIDFPIDEKIHNFKIYDSNEKEIPYQIIDIYETKVIEMPDRFIPYPFERKRFEVVFQAEVKPVGYHCYFVKKGEKENKYFFNFIKESVNGSEERVLHCNNLDTMENEYLKVQVNPNGTLKLINKETGDSYQNLCIFENGGDRGDEYYYIKPLNDKICTTLNTRPVISTVRNGNRLVEVCIEHKLEIPSCLAGNRENRSETGAEITIKMIVNLQPGCRRLDIRGTIENKAEDHRIRMLIPTGCKCKSSFAHNPFDVVERPIDINGTRYTESTFPQTYFVSLVDENRGITVANVGLQEYEILEDRTIAITLLRCVDRIGVSLEAGGASMAPGGQCPGRHTFEVSIIPHRGDWEEARTYMDAYNFNIPMKAFFAPIRNTYIECSDWNVDNTTPLIRECKIHEPILPNDFCLLETETEGLILSGLKQSEDGKDVILRIFNIGTECREALLKIHFDFTGILETNLYEEPLEQQSLYLTGNSLKFEIGRKEIKTFRFYQ